MFISEITPSWLKGITAHPIKLKIKVIKGAKINIIIFALLGKIVSFANSFDPSASGCNNPTKPTTLGPLRR